MTDKKRVFVFITICCPLTFGWNVFHCLSGIGQIDLVSKSQLRQGKLMTVENEQAELMRTKFPSASLHYCFQTVTLDFLWFEANHNRWFDLMWSTSLALCAALHAVCCFSLSFTCLPFLSESSVWHLQSKMKLVRQLQISSYSFALLFHRVCVPFFFLSLVRWTCEMCVFLSLNGGSQLNVTEDFLS